MRALLYSFLLILAATVAMAQPATVITTARADGRMENCLCPADPNGSLEKRLPEINRMREMGPVLLVDAGDFLPPTMDELGAAAMLDAYVIHNYDAVMIGEQELKYGGDWVRRLDERLPLVSANLSYRDGSPVGERLRIIERGDDVFAVTGLIDRETVRRLGPGLYEEFSVSEPAEALAEVLAKVPDDARVIVLAHLPIETIRSHEDWFTGTDLVLGGHNSDLIDGAEPLGDSHLMHVGAKSRQIGLAQFRGSRLKAEIRTISKQLPDDPRIVQRVMYLRRERAANRPPE